MGKYMQNESLDIAVSAIVEEEIQKRKDNVKAEIESLRERLKSKQEQWDEKYKYLKFTVDSESKSGTFENNAIGMLSDMQKLKSEIGELKFCLLLLTKESQE